MLYISSLQYVSLYSILSLLWTYTQSHKIVSACNSPIYCTGELLHTIQMASILPDSKTFVDLKLLKSEAQTIKDFEALMTETDNVPSKTQLTTFLEKHFDEKEELLQWHPDDFDPAPPILSRIKNSNLLQFAKDIIKLWPTFGRKMVKDIATNRKQYSLIPVPNGFIVPGAKFKELYYWESYWIIRGLLISNMLRTARGMIENFLYLVSKFGYVPSANRKYFLGRSHPPLLTWMVYDYFAMTGDDIWLAENIGTVEKELKYWLHSKKVSVEVNGNEYSLLRYVTNKNNKGPRPESYREDYRNAQKVPEKIRELFYTQLKSTTESGWDFSSRWLIISGNKTEFNLTDISTSKILPVDLNAIFAGALQKFGELRMKLGHHKSGKKWMELAEKWRDAIENVLWDAGDGVWYDFDIRSMTRRKYFYLSCAAPLWANAVEPWQVPERARYFTRYLQSTGALKFPGGVPTSIWHTGERWDYPNVWPPLQAMLIGALENSDCSDAKRLAQQLIETWVRTNYLGFKKYKKMFNRYSCLYYGEHAGGPEYEIQYGYGWTNGYILELLQRYGDDLNIQ